MDPRHCHLKRMKTTSAWRVNIWSQVFCSTTSKGRYQSNTTEASCHGFTAARQADTCPYLSRFSGTPREKSVNAKWKSGFSPPAKEKWQISKYGSFSSSDWTPGSSLSGFYLHVTDLMQQTSVIVVKRQWATLTLQITKIGNRTFCLFWAWRFWIFVILCKEFHNSCQLWQPLCSNNPTGLSVQMKSWAVSSWNKNC